jgi:hypothetical protein
VSFNRTRLIAVLSNELWTSTLSNTSHLMIELRERMKRPRVGDLVVEFSAGQRGDSDGVGWLRGIEFSDGQGGDSVNIDGRRVVDAWIVEPLEKPGETFRFAGATFFAVPQQNARQWLLA